MSFECFAPPPPGHITAVVPGPRADPLVTLSPVLAVAMAAGRSPAVVPADPIGSERLTTAAVIGLAHMPRRHPPAGSDAWLAFTPELVALMDRPWRELSQAERYLAATAAARLGGGDLLVLTLPASRLPAPRVLRLVQDLAAAGIGLLWVERRLRLVAALAADAWLVDDGEALGPLPAASLVEDARALRLAFGGTLAP